jgi:cytidylate kinase
MSAAGGEARPDFAIAVDGPSASGKSTVARCVARELGRVYVDSGALYRLVTWQALRHGVDVRNAEALMLVLAGSRWSSRLAGGAVVFTVDDVDPGAELRGEAVREAVSDVAAVAAVRAFVVERLRETTRFGPVVMEGRDIGTVVFPDAPHKFYLDADPGERARRRLGDIERMEGRADAAEVRRSLERRDAKDRGRREAPLQIALHARVIDSTRLGIEEVVARIVAAVREGGRAGGVGR